MSEIKFREGDVVYFPEQTRVVTDVDHMFVTFGDGDLSLFHPEVEYLGLELVRRPKKLPAGIGSIIRDNETYLTYIRIHTDEEVQEGHGFPVNAWYCRTEGSGSRFRSSEYLEGRPYSVLFKTGGDDAGTTVCTDSEPTF